MTDPAPAASPASSLETIADRENRLSLTDLRIGQLDEAEAARVLAVL